MLALLSLSSAEGTDSSKPIADRTLIVLGIAVEAMDMTASDLRFSHLGNAILVESFLFNCGEL